MRRREKPPANKRASFKEIKKAVRSFIYNLNVPARWGQSPFTNVTIDWTVPSDLSDQTPTSSDIHLFKNLEDAKLLEEAKRRGVDTLEDMTYKHFQKEMNLINKAYYEIMTEGDKTGQPFTFPIPTYNITKDFDWENKNLIYLWEATAKYGIPYFSNFVNSDMNPEDARSMCCRLRLDTRKLEARGGGLFGANPLTGSIGVVTLNLPRVGFNSENEKEFLDNIEKLMIHAKESLEIKRKILERLTENNLYPYTKYYLAQKLLLLLQVFQLSFLCQITFQKAL